ncbi:isochorismatase family cysteine hydrolase [Paucibacter sp. R3-3]|uniref:Isochorismatase family cysteine hydrolase n=1 Tax=Roseateles agri TaxID=3098619 RepID=A0ABU5DFY5_9BURK|nr:isochorismatase family cysteine hydrolase [Paucibacter sp. R3-3]MDY0744630.1 isochorismatase family cysteine hydrolase [Paucibacter sp. R3-3]
MMNPKETALVLIEYQNDFTSPGGKLHDAVKGVMGATGMLENTVELVRQAREAGVLIVWVPITFAADYREMSPEPYGILKGVYDGKTFQKNTWGAEMVASLLPDAKDIVVEGKRGLCGFATTNLDFILRSRRIRHVAIGGFLTNCCVESTMRTAYELGYDVVTLTDCCATVSDAAQQAAIEHDFPMFSHPMTSKQLLSGLKVPALA